MTGRSASDLPRRLGEKIKGGNAGRRRPSRPLPPNGMRRPRHARASAPRSPSAPSGLARSAPAPAGRAAIRQGRSAASVSICTKISGAPSPLLTKPKPRTRLNHLTVTPFERARRDHLRVGARGRQAPRGEAASAARP